METIAWQEISKIKNKRRRAYFQWKNKIENIKVDYGAMTEEEFIEYCSTVNMGGEITNGEQFIKYMERWEKSAEYKRLLFLLKEDGFANDLLEIYESTKKKATDESDSQAIKNVLMLQKEITKYRKSIDDFQETEEEVEADDGLITDM